MNRANHPSSSWNGPTGFCMPTREPQNKAGQNRRHCRLCTPLSEDTASSHEYIEKFTEVNETLSALGAGNVVPKRKGGENQAIFTSRGGVGCCRKKLFNDYGKEALLTCSLEHR